MIRDDVEAAWNEFKRDILEVNVAVCRRTKCRKEKRTKWWRKEPEMVVKASGSIQEVAAIKVSRSEGIILQGKKGSELQSEEIEK